MKITYISHATLLIETNGVKIVTDPWVIGSAYCEQWYLFPKANTPHLISDADFVLYSHGHEDHLHPESLKLINPTAQIYYPYSWYDGTIEFFNEMGFSNINEVFTAQTVELAPGVQITYLANNLDNVIVIEDKDTVLVNINDALHSASEGMIIHFINKIKQRWPKIDFVFSSYAGASYFPNAVHFINKNDKEIAEAREQFFLTNFSKVIAGLEPTMAIPFASDFILLDDNQRWINETKFPRNEIQQFFSQRYPLINSQIVEAYPDDFFEDKKFVKTSKYHNNAAQLIKNIDTDYFTEIEAKRNIKYLTEFEFERLVAKVSAHITNKQYIIPEEIRRQIKFSIKISDAVGFNIITVNFRTAAITFEQGDNLPDDIDLLIELRSSVLNHSLDHEWGGDAIIIGYGAEITIFNEKAISEYENYCVRLLSRYPNTKEYLQRTPVRAVRYLLADHIKRNNLWNKLLGRNEKVIHYFDTALTNRELWLNKSKCEVCKACNI